MRGRCPKVKYKTNTGKLRDILLLVLENHDEQQKQLATIILAHAAALSSTKDVSKLNSLLHTYTSGASDKKSLQETHTLYKVLNRRGIFKQLFSDGHI